MVTVTEELKLYLVIYLFIYLFRFYLFIHESQRERDRDTGRGRSRLHAGSLMWDSIPESRNRVQASGSSQEPASPSACVSASLSVSLMKK